MTAIQQTNPQSQQEVLYAAIEAAASDANGAAPAEADGSSPPAVLTPQSLMAYCQSRLQNIGTQIQTAMTQQQNADWEQSSIGGILSELANDSAAASTGGMTNPQECQTLVQNLTSLIQQIQQRDPGCSQLGQLEQLHDAIMGTGCGPFPANSPVQGYYNGSTSGPGQPPNGGTPPSNINADVNNNIGQNEFTNFTGTLNTINSSLNSGATMGMITIQSLVSEQTTAIQLTTSTLQALSDGTEKIVDKIGT